ncbi:MFS transporter [Phytoactinopolyspora mesophila]|uniref:MFS transporter n=1 Tax=Phytoactinopolyspora mesophila TaxID=2650750 RepID=A0A7K3M6R3_9ACTN|nr:MFS transporter [Phytoactinopolyspora mesophila]NDL58945.1 MFS transporter [Phytoactinopolyspora mesophila]
MSALAVQKATGRQWAGLAVLALPTALLGLDVTVLYLALPHLAADLQPSSTQTLWIMDAYGFLIAGFLITMGTVGDRIGRRKLLMIGAVAFGVASVLAAYATSAEMLILARAALGVAGATLMPSTLALISNMFADLRQRALAIGVWATMFALGMAVGPLVGGVLLEHFWWGSVFLVAVPVVALLLVVAPVLLPEYRAPQPGPVDLMSVALSLFAILAVVYGLKEFAKNGLEPEPILAMAAGAGAAVFFVRRQRQLVSPLLDVRLFASRTFSVALAVLLVGLVGVGGVMLLVTQYLQLVEGLEPLVAGAWMGPPALMMLVAAISAPLIARRIRPGYVVAITLALSTIGYLMLTQLDSTPGIALVVIGFSLVYLGLGAIAALGTDLVVGAAPPERAGSAAAMSETVQELGIAVGVATLGSLATAIYRGRIDGNVPVSVPEAAAYAAGDSLPGALAVADQLPTDLVAQAKDAFASGMNVVAAVGAIGITALAILAAVMLRHIGTIGSGQIDDDEVRL